jgi:hypothetical protein
VRRGLPRRYLALVIATNACGHSGVLEIASTGAAAGAGRRSCGASFACPTGQTCDTTDGRTFSCLASGPGKLDDRCDASTKVAALCADGLTCLGGGYPEAGTCVAWCADGGSCPAHKTCTARTTASGVAIKVCLPCNGVYACGAGETCATMTGVSFSCLAAGPRSAGATCDASAGAAVVCGERLVCLATGDPKHGTCTRFCDLAHPCPAGTPCKAVVTTLGVTLRVCL